MGGEGPVIVAEPSARVEFSNRRGVRLECSAQGSPSPKIHWIAYQSYAPEGGGLREAPGIGGLRYQLANGSLVFPPFPASDLRSDVHLATYQCVAASPMGTVLSRPVRLRAVVTEDVEVSARNQEVTLGNMGVLRCLIPERLKGILSVTSWLQDHAFNVYPSSEGDGKLHMLPTGELLIMDVNKRDNYSSYQCRTTDRLTGETRLSTRPARIIVKEETISSVPRFAEVSTVVEARQGDLVILPCLATSSPPPEFRWELGKRILDHGRRGGVLVIPGVSVDDGGDYRCVARNGAGSAEATISLIVVSPLSSRVTPTLLTAALGQPAQFLCLPSGKPINTIIWMKNGKRLEARGEEVLRIAAVRRDDQGMYQCFISNEQDVAQAASELRLGDTPPHLIYRFIRQTIQPGPSVSLKCVASGNPTPNIKWTLDGFPLPQNERFVIGQYVPVHGDVISHVNITSVRVEDGGTYECTAINRIGQVSHRAQLNIYGSPHVRPMGEVSVVAGENMFISCPAAGYPIYKINWFRGDRLLPTHRRHVVFDNGTLLVEKLQAGVEGDGGLYRCSASDKMGRSASGTVTVKVMVPPKITPFSFRLDLHLGDRVGVQCVVSKGDPPLIMSWLKDGHELKDVELDGVVVRFLDDFTSVLSIGALAPHHGGNYSCLASNAVASTRHTAPLSVNVPPAITPFSFGELSLGERVRVTCSVKRGDPPLSISWFKDSQPLNHENNLHDITIIQDLQDYSSILSITKVDSKHSGNYTCRAHNPARSVSYTASLLVTVPPTWVLEPRDIVVKMGETFVIDCKVEGFPIPKVSWKKASGSNPGQYQDITKNTFENGSLLLENIKQSDQGNYLCEASNGVGVGLSAVILLTVNAPAQFKVRSRKEMVRRGSVATLQCMAYGDLPISLTWRKSGIPIESNDRKSVKNGTHISGGHASELIIRDVITEDNGVYTCYASNQYGNDQTAIHLLVQDVPSPPSNLRVVEQGSRRITVSWTAPKDGNSAISSYILRYMMSQGEPSSEIVIGGSETSGTLSGLHPAKEYIIYVVAENNVGSGKASTELRIRTEEEIPSGVPRHITSEAPSSTQLVVTWDPPPIEEHNGILVGHYVGFRETRDTDVLLSKSAKQYNFTTVPYKGLGREETRLNGLKKFTKYAIVIQAFNSKGPGPLSKEIITQTLEDVPEGAPRQVQCTALSAESLQVYWQPPMEPLVHGIIQGYKILYRSTENDRGPVNTQTKLTTALSTILHGLLKYNNYSIEVLAFTKVGDGVKSDPIHCITKEDVPDAPAGIKALVDSNDSILITWLPPVHTNGVLLKYGLYVRLIEGGLSPPDIRIIHHPPGTPENLLYRLQGLKQRIKYEFYVTAFTKVGEGQSTPVVTVTQSNKVPAAIASFGGVRTVAWKSDVKLKCKAVGDPKPQLQWLIGDVPVNQQPRLSVSNEGTLTIKNVQKSDQAEYTCEVRNRHSQEQISYHLIIQVPPSAPLLLATGSFSHSLQLQWKLGDDGGSPILGYTLHVKFEQGEWEEFRLPSTPSTYTLKNLRCGTLFNIFLTAYNKVGGGESSQILEVRTRGSLPAVPSIADLLSINSTLAVVHLNSWPDGGCPILYFTIEYTNIVGRLDDYTIVGNNIRADKPYLLMGLTPATEYRLRVTAFNAAGSTKATYQFVTLSLLGEVVVPSHVVKGVETQSPFHKELSIIILSAITGFAFIMSLLAMCLCLRKRGRTNDTTIMPTHDIQGTALQDNKHNLARREQYYATVRKLSPSPEALDCIPEYAEDVRPYATFQVPNTNDVAKFQTFMYWGREMSPGRKSASGSRDKDEYCRGRKCRQRSSEEFDSYGSESDTEQGTSSRTESSNQLDDAAERGCHIHARKSHEVISQTWIQSPPHFHRRYYQHHQK